MKLLSNKRFNFFGKARGLYRENCFCFRNFIYRLTKNMCFSKEEIEALKEKVELTIKHEEKYNEWERIMPDVREYIEKLKGEIDRVQEEKLFCINGIREIYLADVAKDEELKVVLFARFGLPFVLNQEQKQGE